MIRVLWRLAHRAPTLPDTMPAWQRTVAAATHGLLYLLVIAIPLSGWLMSSAFGFQTVYLGLAPLPDLLAKNKVLAEQLRSVHQALNWALLVVAVVHVAAALKHYLVDRDDVLSRMLPILKPRA
jgi:cytochrome b561